MKKSIIILITLFFVSGTLSAQKKPAKKSVTEISKTITDSPPPMMSVSSEEKKYEHEKICANCDTLVLEVGKPHIVIYDIQQMSSWESRIYREQPDKNNSSDEEYYTLKDLGKREWEELHRNFPENKVTYHHVFRNTLIKAQNSTKENVNFLNRQEQHEGFIYWSGKPTDKILQSKKMVFATEQISKICGDRKISSYYSDFKQDSLLIENLMKTTVADENVKSNINLFLQKEILKEHTLPFEFMDFTNVKTIHLEISPEKKATFTFNTSGQLTGFNDHENEIYKFIYKNNLPISVLKNDKPYAELAFQGNNISLKNNQFLKTFQLFGKLFLSTKQFYTEKEQYEMMNLKSPVHWEIKTENNQICEYFSRTDSPDESTTCYSNNQYQLPLTITYHFKNPSFEMTNTTVSTMNENGEIVVKSENERKSSKLKYKIEKGILKTFQYFTNDEDSPAILVKYEFYK